MQQQIDGIYFSLAEPFDFSFLSAFGRVFQVFDQQDSGNICFGCEAPEGRRFIKFSGAPTLRAARTPQQAIEQARHAADAYHALAHEHLVNCLYAGQAGGGYIQVFPWVEGLCWGKMYPNQRRRFLALSDAVKLKIYETILDFHLHVLACGWVCVDFYDGSVLYQPETGKTYICDIEFYQKQPYINRSGRLPGSSRFMSPEEWSAGMPIDARSCIFVMGATAFELFGGGCDRSASLWRLNEASRQAALRAVQPDRDARWPSLEAYENAWQAALE